MNEKLQIQKLVGEAYEKMANIKMIRKIYDDPILQEIKFQILTKNNQVDIKLEKVKNNVFGKLFKKDNQYKVGSKRYIISKDQNCNFMVHEGVTKT